MADSPLRSPAKPTKQASRADRLALLVLKQHNRFSNALSLQSDKYLDQRGQSEEGSRMSDTELSDDSISSSGETSRRSVLDLGTKSYARPEGEEPSTVGGGFQEGATSDIARARQLQETMVQQQAQFVGAEGKARRGAGRMQATAEGLPAEQEAEGEEDADEEEQAEQLMQDKAQQLRKQATQKMEQKTAKMRAEQIQQQMKKTMNRATKTGARLTMEGAELAGSEVIVPLLILIAQLNVQMIMKYTFKPMLFEGRFGGAVDQAMDGAPWIDQSFVEDIATIGIDIILTCAGICCNPCCFIPILFVIVPAGVMNGGLDKVKTAVGQ